MKLKLTYYKYKPKIKAGIKKLRKSYKKKKPKMQKTARRVSRNIDNYFAENTRQIRTFKFKV